MHGNELSVEQRRQSADVQQAADALRPAKPELRQRDAGSMRCKARNGLEHLDRAPRALHQQGRSSTPNVRSLPCGGNKTG